MMLRFVPRGRETVLDLIQRCARNGEVPAQRWLAVYQDLREIDRKRADLDAICEVASVRPDEFMAMVISTAMRLGSDAADLTAAVMHPRIVAQTAKSAMRIGGENAEIAQKDRQWILENRGFIMPKAGSMVTVNAVAAAQSAPSVPSFLDSIGSAAQVHRSVQKAIETSIDAESSD